MDTQHTTNLSVYRTTKGKLPSLPFVQIKNTILSKKYDLSVTFIGRKKMKEIHKKYTEKDYATNILSFPLSDMSGEILMSLETIRRDAKKYNKTYKEFTQFLLIHGMLHLKGFDHGKDMEKFEDLYTKKFSFKQ